MTLDNAQERHQTSTQDKISHDEATAAKRLVVNNDHGVIAALLRASMLVVIVGGAAGGVDADVVSVDSGNTVTRIDIRTLLGAIRTN